MTPIPRTEAVVGLIRVCFEEGWAVTPSRPLLADALQEADWPEEKVLTKLRSPVNVYLDSTPWRIVALGILPVLCGWAAAFEFAGEVPWDDWENAPGKPNNEPNVITSHPGDETTPTTPFGRQDVAEVVALSPGENDGKNWLCLGRLRDGRWFFLSAGCDYTGWDCRAWGTVNVGPSEYVVKKFSMGPEDRRRLGCPFKDDPAPLMEDDE